MLAKLVMRRRAAGAVTLVAALAVPAAAAQARPVQTAAALPSWSARAMVARPGHAVHVVLKPGARSECTVFVRSPDGTSRHWKYLATADPMRFGFKPSRRTEPGRWRLTASCDPLGPAGPRRASARVTVRTGAHGTGFLVGRHGPYMNSALPAPGTVGRGGATNPFPFGQCTFYGYEARSDIYTTSVANGAPRGGPDGQGGYVWDAWHWTALASQYGHFPVGTTPVVGAIMVAPRRPGDPNSVGHIAYVVGVRDGTHFTTHEMNTYGDGDPSGHVYTVERTTVPGMTFIYGGPAGNPGGPAPEAPPTNPTPAQGVHAETAGGYARTWSDYTTAGGVPGTAIQVGQTVQIACKVTGFRVADGNTWWYRLDDAPWNGAFYATADAFYNNGTTSGSLHGTPFVDTAVPDCSAVAPGAGPPAPTWTETTGGVAHTWTDYTSAGGTQGPSIPSNTGVQIACRVTGFRVADGNTWWYRIASSPWNGTYYASADAFYNNGATSGSLHGTPFVDAAVALC